jgi:uncharacterized membrane protein
MAMTPGIGFALGAMLCFGASDLIYKRGAAAGFSAGEFLMSQAWIFCPGVTLYAWLTGTLQPHVSALWGGLAGFFLFIALFNFTRSLRSGAVSTNAPIFRLNFTVTAALAILLLGETLTVAKAVALLCALLAVWLLLAEACEQGGKSSWPSLIRVLIATAAIGADQFALQGRFAERRHPGNHGGGAGLGVLHPGDDLRLGRRRRLLDSARIWPYAACAALALFGAFVALMHGLALGPASVLVPVAQMSFVFTALFGAAMFRERLDAKKCAGLAIAVAALVLFAVS